MYPGQSVKYKQLQQASSEDTDSVRVTILRICIGLRLLASFAYGDLYPCLV